MSQLWSKDPVPTGALWQRPHVSPVAAHTPNASPLSPAEARVKNPGKRYAQIVKLKPAHYAEYKRVHAAVWPEVAKQIKNCNIIDCTLLARPPFPPSPPPPPAATLLAAPPHWTRRASSGEFLCLVVEALGNIITAGRVGRDRRLAMSTSGGPCPVQRRAGNPGNGRQVVGRFPRHRCPGGCGGLTGGRSDGTTSLLARVVLLRALFPFCRCDETTWPECYRYTTY